MKNGKFNLLYWAAAMLGLIVVQYIAAMNQQVATIPYSQFQQLLNEGKVAEVGVSDRFMQGSLKEPLPGGQTRFATTRVDPEIAKELEGHGVKFNGQIESTLFRDILSWILPMALFIGVYVWLGRRMAGAGGLMQIGKSRAKVYVESDTRVTFADVAGVDEAKDELREVVDFLREPDRYGRLGGRMPKGVLLVGPPGTGKTLLARAVAGEARVPFLSISGAEFVEMFVGVGAARVRDLFEQARAKAPAIIFIDELDALGRARGLGGAYGGGVNSEAEQTLNQLLVEMDGFDSRTGLVILAATNRPEILDPALLRAGRFDRQVLVDRPDRAGRVQILNVHLKRVTLAPDVAPEKIAGLTPGFTGADLANLVNEAALLATRRGAEAVTLEDFGNAVERIVAGLEKRNRLLNPREREIVAHHEIGHALVAMSLPGSDPVHKVSIIPRGIGALGYTIQRPTEDRFLMTREELERKMMVLLGGRAAELVVYGHLSTGAADDLQRVTDIARGMVTRYGMSEALGSVAYERDPRSLLAGPNALPSGPREQDYGEAAGDAIDAEVRRIVDGALEQTVTLLREKREVLERTARRLLEKETLEEGELNELMGVPPRPAKAAE
ncbi:ATP-dependent zinc metalloprotease FtsH [Roseicella aquatilis]|uniref:ATP-dependent zinc metalloprotease FtsH n=1 Tax=Roseicella aquatilis TaxID=2527868 RepID=A0A4R4DW37_9PROT|nr:ATP-dependent zinc metalloprotease FtsH [Roseicella aquatilis]TCZ65516.1 ATP-dependent metallopeptidase FtsH/Yme1/Tma family protein [Roseicella aquatilis]